MIQVGSMHESSRNHEGSGFVFADDFKDQQRQEVEKY
jgi:hypothetical protein